MPASPQLIGHCSADSSVNLFDLFGVTIGKLEDTFDVTWADIPNTKELLWDAGRSGGFYMWLIMNVCLFVATRNNRDIYRYTDIV